MDKIFATDDHKNLLEATGGHMFTFFERSDKMTKSASDVISRSVMQEHMPPDDHFGVHLITMGAEETYGPNRNGDSSSQGALDKYHGTFEKYGHVFREHANRDARTQGVGHVKLAAVNPAMHRGELIVWVNKDKAPDMYKKAREGKELSWSMSMRIPHDECSCCGKKSRSTDEYCNDLRDNMLQWRPQFQKYAYARNEERIKLFDISEVGRRADRIATYLRYTFPGEEMSKAASTSTIITGAEWAAHLRGPSLDVAEFTAWEDLTLEKLAAAEEFVRHASVETLTTLASMAPSNLTADQIETLAKPDFRNGGGALAKKAMFINFPTFASLVTGETIADLEKNADFCGARDSVLPKVFSEFSRNGGACCGSDVAESVTPDDMGCEFNADKDPIDTLMAEVGDDLEMTPDKAQDRGLEISISITKSASLRRAPAADPDPFYGGLAEAYGFYLVKAAHIAKAQPNVSENILYRVLAASVMTKVS